MAYYRGLEDEISLGLAIHQLIGEVDELCANVEEHWATWNGTFGEPGNPVDASSDNEARSEMKSSDGHREIPRVDKPFTRLQKCLLLMSRGGGAEPTLQGVQSAPKPINVCTDSQRPTLLPATDKLPATDRPDSRRGQRRSLRAIRPKSKQDLNNHPQSASTVIRPGSNKFTDHNLHNKCHEASQRRSLPHLFEGIKLKGNELRRLAEFGGPSSTDSGIPPERKVTDCLNRAIICSQNRPLTKKEAKDCGGRISHGTAIEDEKQVLPESEGDVGQSWQSATSRPWLESNASALVRTSNTPDSDSLEFSQPINIRDVFISLQTSLSGCIDGYSEEFRELGDLAFCRNITVNVHQEAAVRNLSQGQSEITKDASGPGEQLHVGSPKQEFNEQTKQILKCYAAVTGVPKKDGENVRDILKRIGYALGYPVDEMYVEEAFRLSRTDPAPPIIVRFKFELIKYALIKASSRKELRADQLGI